MARFEKMKGLFGLLPTPYREDLEIYTEDLRSAIFTLQVQTSVRPR